MVEKGISKALLKKYGIALYQYQNMIAVQDAKCAICECRPGKRALCIDHDHETGRVRGLLCGNCNTALGLFKEDEESLFKAIGYLRAHREYE